MAVHASYPVRVEGSLDPELSRFLWIVKWLLAIPHYIVLCFLWIGFFLSSIAAFFAILFTGSYPKGIFRYNVGVLRWSWRVSYYAYGALGTDRYPPFSLQDDKNYPARLEIDYPEHLSRGLVLIKWWLLAIPHYLIVGVLVGGTYFAVREEMFASTGLIGILVLIAGFALAFTGRYPKTLFDLVLGLNRWVLRVAAYAGLMTDEYPPFRLDQGGSEEGHGTISVSSSATDASHTGAAAAKRGWGPGSVISVVVGSLIALMAFGVAAGGAFALWADQTQRDAAGFVTTESADFTTSSHALVVEEIELSADGPDAVLPSTILGEARIRATSMNEGALFVGVGPAEKVDEYLAGVSYSEVMDVTDRSAIEHSGDAPKGLPGEQSFWTESATGTGTTPLRWDVQDGEWSIVVMNADGTAGVDVSADAGAEVPALPWIGLGLIIAGIVGLLIGALFIGLAARSASKPKTA